MRQIVAVHGCELELELPSLVGRPLESKECDRCEILIFTDYSEARMAGVPYWPYDNKRIDGCLCFDCAIGKILDCIGLHEQKFEIAEGMEPPGKGIGCNGKLKVYKKKGEWKNYRIWHKPQREGMCPTHGMKGMVRVSEEERSEAERLIGLWEGAM